MPASTIPLMRETLKLRQAIVEFLRVHPGSTMAELVAGVPECAGPYTVGSAYSNLILWKGVSMDAVQALAILERGRHIRFEATTIHPYGQAGRDLNMPYAMKPQDYETPHWLPVLLHANRKATNTQT